MAPKFSIVTVTYNDCKRLAETLASIQTQVFQEFEYLIIDGASQDDTARHVEAFSQFRPLTYVCEKDAGLYDAMNKGARKAAGEFVFFLNAGDTLTDIAATERIQTQILSHFDCDAIYGDVIVIDSFSRQRLKKAHPLGQLYKGLPSSHQALLLRRTCYLRFPFDQRLRLAADFDVGLKTWNFGAKNWIYMEPPFSAVTAGGLSDVNRFEARLECMKVLLQSGTLAQKLQGISYQCGMMFLDKVGYLGRRILGESRHAKLKYQLRKKFRFGGE